MANERGSVLAPQRIKPEQMTMRVSQAVEMFQASQSFDGYAKAVKGGEDSVVVPYDISGTTRIAIAMNIRTLRTIVQAHTDAVAGLQKSMIPDFDPKTASPAERLARVSAMQQFNEQIRKMDDAEVDVSLCKIDVSELKLETNPISPNVLAMLEPILTFGD